jgi:hypothetical protein
MRAEQGLSPTRKSSASAKNECISIRQHTSAYISSGWMRAARHDLLHVRLRTAYVIIRQAAYVNIYFEWLNVPLECWPRVMLLHVRLRTKIPCGHRARSWSELLGFVYLYLGWSKFFFLESSACLRTSGGCSWCLRETERRRVTCETFWEHAKHFSKHVSVFTH